MGRVGESGGEKMKTTVFEHQFKKKVKNYHQSLPSRIEMGLNFEAN